MGRRVLLLDDDPTLARAITRTLRSHSIEVDAMADVDRFFHFANENIHAVLMIDWHLRTCVGTDVCRQLRTRAEARPIALISGKLDANYGERVAREAGADRYIEKPFTGEALAAEIAGMLGDAETRTPLSETRIALPAPIAERLAVSVALSDRSVTLSNVSVQLRPKERAVFEVLLKHVGRTVSKEELVRLAWGMRVVPSSTVVETTMSRLRHALGPAAGIIQTVEGGYTITARVVVIVSNDGCCDDNRNPRVNRQGHRAR